MNRVPVKLADNGYDVLVEPGSIKNTGSLVQPFIQNGRAFIVSDENVASALLDEMEASLAQSSISSTSHILPAGESTKSWQHIETLSNFLLEHGIERSDTLVALGGGVIGDLTGFAASILKRGCNFIQVPTTLLAQVDSSVGGKTAINSKAGKNLIGAFKQPKFVLIDPDVLGSLPDRELRAGYAEVVKYGLINDHEFFSWCEANSEKLLTRDPDALTYAITKSVQAKAKIVAEDEKELSGTRALLNLGHTFGHALEAETGYSEKLVHGEAVAAGMALAFHYSVRRGHCQIDDAVSVEAHLKASGLPYSLASAGVQASGGKLVAHMMHDKKMSAGTLPFLLVNGIGETYLAKDVDLTDVAEFLDEVS